MKFLVPNYGCHQNPWLGGYHPHILILSVLNWICWPPPKKKFLGTPLLLVISVSGGMFFWQVSSSEDRRQAFNCLSAAPLFRRFRAFTFINWHDRITISQDRRYFSQLFILASTLTFVPTDYQFEDIRFFSACSFWLSIIQGVPRVKVTTSGECSLC